MRVFFHVQHLLGIGHDRRAALIARALVAGGARVTVARGGHPVPGVDYGGAEVVQLPPARAADATFKVLLDDSGRPVGEAWRAARAAATLAAFARAEPDVLLVESFPFGRRAFRFEMLPLFAAARGRGIPVAVSVRDILVGQADPKRLDEVVATVERFVDAVLVHGDPALIPFAATFPAAERIAERIHYTGYVAAPASDLMDGRDGAGEVLVSVGGGAVGLPLLRAALHARPLTPLRDAPWRLLAGPDVPEDAVRALAADAPPGVTVERARPDFPALLRRCRLSVSQAGYNTVLDLLQAGCRAVVVPFADAGQTEQALRARLLEDRGRLTVVDEAGLTPESLAAGIAHALAAPPPAPMPLRLDGAAESARLLAALPHGWPLGWEALRAELDAWAAAGRTATFWWRDDDAVEPTPQLARLTALAARTGVPLALAVVPAHAAAALAEVVAVAPGVTVLQHGWAHTSHAGPGEKRIELGGTRSADAVLADLVEGRARLTALFGARFVPALVPPWNRIARPVAERLTAFGFTGLSTFTPRTSLFQVNTHVDPMDWRNGGRFAGEAAALRAALAHLRARRLGTADPDEPTGLLTHHLVMDEATWAFAERFLEETRAHPAVRWVGAVEIFPRGGLHVAPDAHT